MEKKYIKVILDKKNDKKINNHFLLKENKTVEKKSRENDG